jgi:hypothetical protein
MGHCRQQAARLHRYGLAAGVRAADEQNPMLLVQFQGDRHD